MVKNLSDYGLAIKMRLLELGKSQEWLIEQVESRTGLYFDSGYMHKVLCGTAKSENILTAINEILGI